MPSSRANQSSQRQPQQWRLANPFAEWWAQYGSANDPEVPHALESLFSVAPRIFAFFSLFALWSVWFLGTFCWLPSFFFRIGPRGPCVTPDFSTICYVSLAIYSRHLSLLELVAITRLSFTSIRLCISSLAHTMHTALLLNPRVPPVKLELELENRPRIRCV